MIRQRFEKIHLEITNVCNAACSFCPGTAREPRFISDGEFFSVLTAIEGRAEYLYFHIMGEPLLHPSVRVFAAEAKRRGFRVMITTNGLLSDVGRELVSDGNVYRIGISVHSFEGNRYSLTEEEYLDNCFEIADCAAERGTIAALKLWNSEKLTGDGFSARVMRYAEKRYGGGFSENRSGYRLRERIFIETGERYLWPGQGEKSPAVFCHALRRQFGILCDGTVVPCCLDCDGRMPLGNIFDSDIDAILSSERAERIYNGFTEGRAVELPCQTCGFAGRFSGKRS